MNYTQARNYLLSRPEAWEDFPFGSDAAVMKIDKKLFAILSNKNDMASINLKCNPEEALMLRDIFPAVTPGYHMNKRHWNTVLLNGSIPCGETERMIDASYALVLKSLPKAARQALEIRHGKDQLYR